jgi:hypothetical protein
MDKSKLHSLPKELLIKILENANNVDNLSLEEINALSIKINQRKNILLTEQIKNEFLSLIVSQPPSLHVAYAHLWPELSNFLETHKKFIVDIICIEKSIGNIYIAYPYCKFLIGQIYAPSDITITITERSNDILASETYEFLTKLLKTDFEFWNFCNQISQVFYKDMSGNNIKKSVFSFKDCNLGYY